MIIDDLMEKLSKEKKTDREKLIEITKKMKEEYLENNEYNKFLDIPEILYYYKYTSNDYFDKFLVLDMDPLEDNSYGFEIWEFKKVSEGEDPKYIKTNRKKSNQIKPIEVLLQYTKYLKQLL